MKKLFIALLMLVLTLGAAGSTFAANENPFNDVPKKHWSYEAIDKLATDGLLESNSTKTFNGDKVITRYEMAKLVAKVMSKADKANAKDKALIDRLAGEFADELTSLNVTVTKLEKDSERINIGAFAMLKYDHRTNPGLLKRINADGGFGGSRVDEFNDVIRGGFKLVVFSTYKLSDTWTVETVGEFTRGMQDGSSTPANRDQTKIFSISGKLDGMDLKVGRFHYVDACSGYVIGEDMSGVQARFGKVAKITANAGWLSRYDLLNNPGWTVDPLFGYDIQGYTGDGKGPRYQAVDITYPISRTTNIAAAYHRLSKDSMSRHINEAGFDTQLTENLKFKAAFSKSSADTDNDGYFAGLDYGRADFFKPGTWDAHLYVSKTDATASIANNYDSEDGYYGSKAVEIGGNYTLRPKVMLETKYIIQKGTKANTDWKDKFFRLQFNFMLM
ncbi:S-layer homology domain-containing protein [Sporomusa aerivorans]|uniref:S-layer homology domain-containing protein n=1 Tax=Sporomusa aerivorans TaxID=204936 RepID=UPI00352A5DA5